MLRISDSIYYVITSDSNQLRISDLHPNYPPSDDEKDLECIAGTEL